MGVCGCSVETAARRPAGVLIRIGTGLGGDLFP